MADYFHVILPSNASYETFRDNKLHSYKVKVPKLPIQSGKWRVGMTEIEFPARWPNIIGGNVTIGWNNGVKTKFELDDGFYPDIDKLLEKINILLNNAKCKGNIIMHYDKLRNRMLMKVRNEMSTGISFSQNLLHIMGFNRDASYFFSEGNYTSDYAPDIHDGLQALYVYSDIVQNRLVGDKLVPLLRVVPTEPSDSRQSFRWIKFMDVQYVPVVATHTDIIEINIRRDDGSIIPFESGKVNITLRFQKEE